MKAGDDHSSPFFKTTSGCAGRLLDSPDTMGSGVVSLAGITASDSGGGWSMSTSCCVSVPSGVNLTHVRKEAICSAT
jgi:hypothetical protein